MPRWILRVVLLAASAAAARRARSLLPDWRRSLTGAAIAAVCSALGWPSCSGRAWSDSSACAICTAAGGPAGRAGTCRRAGADRRRPGAVLRSRASTSARGWRPPAWSAILAGGLLAVLSLLLRIFSVFTTVSTMGVVLGVASLVVVLAVTSGFEREFQDKVLALNAHLIVIAYGDADIDATEATTSSDAARHARRGAHGEVPVLGGRGDDRARRRQPEGHRPQDRAPTSCAARSIEGNVEDLAKPASCDLPSGTPRKTTDRRRAHRHRRRAGAQDARRRRRLHADHGAVQLGRRDAPASFLFKVVGHLPHGLQRVRHAPGLREHRGRAPAGERAPARSSASSCASRDPMLALTASARRSSAAWAARTASSTGRS